MKNALAIFFLTFLSASLAAQQPKATIPTGVPAGKAPVPAKKTDVLTSKSGASTENVEMADLESYRPKPVDTLVAPTIITFGSCNKVQMPQTMWSGIAANNPDLWIWLGDIIYADTTDMQALAAHYKRLKTNPESQRTA